MPNDKSILAGLQQFVANRNLGGQQPVGIGSNAGGNITPAVTPPSDLFNKNKQSFVDSVFKANQHLDWVQRLFEKNAPSIQLKGVPERSTHYMSDDGKGYVFPSVVRQNGKLVYLGDRAEEYARKTNTGIQFPKPQGDWFANNGYKLGTGVNNSINPQGIPYNNPAYQIPQ